MQSSLGVDAPPEAVSRPGFSTKGWFPVTLPSTVLGGLVADHEYPDLYVGTNLQNVWEPRFQVPWWYRTEFELDDVPGARTQLHFDGINYRADVYLNGTLVAGSDRVAGAFRTYTFDVTDVVHPGTNALAVRVYPVDARHDLTITWIDWSPLAPDHGMGIWHDVWLTRTGGVTVRDPQVVSDLPLPATDHADLTVTATVHNAGDSPVDADVAGTIGSIAFSRTVALAPGESKLVTFDPANVPAAAPDRPARVVAVPDGGPAARGADRDRVGGRRGVRPRLHVVRHPRGDVRVHAERRAPVPDQRATDPDPRRRVGVGHAAPPGASARRRSADVRARHGTERGPLGGQAGIGSLLRRGRPAGDPRHARLDVLRLLAAVVEVDRRRTGDRPGVHDVAGRSDAQPPERDHVHDRERHQTGPRRAGDVREGPARRALAQPDPGVGIR